MKVHIVLDDQAEAGTTVVAAFSQPGPAKVAAEAHHQSTRDPEGDDAVLEWKKIPETARRGQVGPTVATAGGPGIFAPTDWGGLMIVEIEVKW